jgi:hypothetical protein
MSKGGEAGDEAELDGPPATGEKRHLGHELCQQ